MKDVVVGYSKFVSKEGKKCCKLQLVSDLNERQKQFGNVGMIVEDQWVPVELHDLVTPVCVGKVCVREYEFSGGRPYVIGMTFEERLSND